MDKLTTGILTYNDAYNPRVYYWIKPKVVYYIDKEGRCSWTNAPFKEYSGSATYKVIAPGGLTAWTS